MSIRGTLCALTGGTYMADKNFLTDIIDADLFAKYGCID